MEWLDESIISATAKAREAILSFAVWHYHELLLLRQDIWLRHTSQGTYAMENFFRDGYVPWMRCWFGDDEAMALVNSVLDEAKK